VAWAAVVLVVGETEEAVQVGVEEEATAEA